MLHALITQREGQNMYGKSTDVLEAAYTEFYESMGIRLHPVSNFTRDFEALFEDPIDVLIVTGGGTLHPKYYVEPHKAELQPHRDAMEERLNMAKICNSDRYIKINNFHSDCVYLENLSTMFYPLVVDEENGSVEAFVSPTMSILAFQWHPERYFESEEGRLFSRHLIQDFLGIPRDDKKPDL